MFGVDLVINESTLHAGAILLLKVNFLTFVLLYSTYNLYSAFLVMSNLVGVKMYQHLNHQSDYLFYTLKLSHL